MIFSNISLKPGIFGKTSSHSDFIYTRTKVRDLCNSESPQNKTKQKEGKLRQHIEEKIKWP